MTSEDATDVTKALAAFGAPSIRYHSFGHGPVKPSGVVRTRREMVPPPPPVSAPSHVAVAAEGAAGPVAPPLARPDAPRRATDFVAPTVEFSLAAPVPERPPVPPMSLFGRPAPSLRQPPAAKTRSLREIFSLLAGEPGSS